MALNSSGPISLGGTTTGQSIAIENGGTGTATISLNDAAVRSLAGVASGAIIMPTNFYGKSNATYLIARFNNTTAFAITQDTSGNIYFAGDLNNANRMGMGKLTSTGTLTWSNGISSGGNYGTPKCVAFATGGTTVNVNLSGYNFLYSTSGTYNGTYYSYASVSGDTFLSGFSLNMVEGAPNGYFYGSGSAEYSYCCSTWQRWGVSRINSSGTADITYFFPNVGQVPGQCISVDASGNVYSGAVAYTGSQYYAFWCKLNSSLGIVASGYFAGSYEARQVRADSSGNIYLLATVSGNLSSILYKMNSSGTLQWQRQIGLTSGSGAGEFRSVGLNFDSSNNVYVLGMTAGASGPSQFGATVVKFDTSGTLQWKRRFYNTSYNNAFVGYPSTANPILVNAGALAFSTSPTTGSGIIFMYPLDGSITGSYPITSAGTWVISVDTLTNVTTSTTSAGSFSISQSSLTVSGNTRTNTNTASAVNAPTIVSL